ncbi:MAG: thioredoxin family protein [Saprospiraceae bacterium]|nr:thioredoxin family protein [Saprospiraceae bacterium]
MKKLVVILFLMSSFGLNLYAQTTSDNATAIFSEACLQAKEENKNVIVIFKASWCKWCHKMENSINDMSCAPFFDKSYKIVYFIIDEAKDKKHLETPGAKDFNTKYLGDRQGLPFWLVFDADGKLLADCMMRTSGQTMEQAGQNVGCPASDEEVNTFTDILKKTSGLKEHELDIIAKRFKQNAAK